MQNCRAEALAKAGMAHPIIDTAYAKFEYPGGGKPSGQGMARFEFRNPLRL
jgi:hypothetical protein